MKITRPKSKQPLPKKAKKVFSGKIFDVYQWKQKMFDGSEETFEKLKRPDTVIVFPVLDDGKILLTKQQQPGKEPFIGAAGGRVDPGENILTAAKRELLEETGYEAKKYTLWKSVQPISKMEWAVYVFIAKDVKKAAEMNLDAGEKIKLLPVSFDKFMKVVLKSSFMEQEIYSDVLEAKYNKTKEKALRKLLSTN